MRIFLLLLRILKLIGKRQERKTDERITRTITDQDRLVNSKVIADALSVGNALQVMLSRNIRAEKPLNLKAIFETKKSYDAIFEELKNAQVGFQMNVLPININYQPNNIYFIEHVAKSFKRLNKGVADFIRKHKDSFPEFQLDNLILLTSDNPGSYYDGVNLTAASTQLQNHPLLVEFEVLNLIDIPFTDVLCRDDNSLWKLSELCPRLRWIDLSATELNSADLEQLNFHHLKCLSVLSLSENNLHELPVDFNAFPALEYLNLRSNQLRKLPGYLGSLKNLKYLNLKDNPISDSEIKRLKERLNKTVIEF